MVSSSLQQTANMESNGQDYFSPIPSTTQTTLTPGLQIPIPYDVRVAREFDRISRELANAKRFGDPSADALGRLRTRTMPTTKDRLTKKPNGFALGMTWKRSPDKDEYRTRRGRESFTTEEVFDGERRSKAREILRQLWLDEGDRDRDDGDIGAEMRGRSRSH